MTKLTERSLLAHTRKAMHRYGTYTNEDRAIPDYRDGFKPVHRRTVWALKNLPKDVWIKTSRVAGDVIGKYHPHGSAPVEGAVQTLVNSANPPVLGMGNWGTAVDGAAAARYTNVQLSDYGKLFLRPDYLAVTETVTNYDGNDVEPVVLPALLPQLLLNGTEGIGVGIRNSIPSYSLPSVVKTLIERLKRPADDPLTPKELQSLLEFKFPWGGRLVKTPENLKALRQFYQTGQGSVLFESALVFSNNGLTIRWADFTPNVAIESTVVRVRALPGVLSAINTTDLAGASFEFTLKKAAPAELEKLHKKIWSLTSASRAFRVSLTERSRSEKGEIEVRLFNSTISEMIDLWLKWRVKLEVKCLEYRMTRETAAINYSKLLLYAISKLDVVMASLRQQDPAAYLMKHLKLTEQQANQILDLRVRQLSKLDKQQLDKKLAEQQAHLAQLQAWRKAPSKKVVQDLQEILASVAQKKPQNHG